ncbi:MAG: hypothetical protein ABL867_06190 [Rickettsiales bacterium]
MSENETTTKKTSASQTPTYDSLSDEGRANIVNKIQEIRQKTESKGLNYSPDQEWRMKEAFAKQNTTAQKTR